MLTFSRSKNVLLNLNKCFKRWLYPNKDIISKIQVRENTHPQKKQ